MGNAGVELVPVRFGADPEFDQRLYAYWIDLGVVPDPAWHRRYLERLAEEEGRSRNTFWGQTAGARVGFVVLRIDTDWVYPDRRIGYIAEFSVFSGLRRRGTGRALFGLCCTWFAKRGCGQVELDVLPANRPGQAFWRAMGCSLTYHHLRLERGL